MMFGPLLNILIIIMFGYSVIKVFFGSLKRGGILLIQIAVGAMYMFSIRLGDDGVYISFWNSDDDYFLKPESEVFTEQKFEQTMGGLN